MDYSVLGKRRGKEGEEKPRPDFFLDLNLDPILAKIADTRRNYELKEYYYEFPADGATIRYRQAVGKDLDQEVLFEGMLEFSNEMKTARDFRGYAGQSLDDLQKKRWHLDSNYHYVKAVEALGNCLSRGTPESEGLLTLKGKVDEVIAGEDFAGLKRASVRLREQFDRMHVRVELTPKEMVISQEALEDNYLDRLDGLLPDAQGLSKTMENPFPNVLKLSSFERKVLEVFQKNVPEAFASLHEYHKRYGDCMEPFFIRLEQELQFYLAFRLYRERMEAMGCAFAVPFVREGAPFQVGDAYDLALAHNVYSKRSLMGEICLAKNRSVPAGEVVGNDARYEEGERFFVVTGPNQGGKTTFARSVGQVVYFALLGLPAPCKSAKLPLFSGMLTHFSVEESVDTGKGKLKEELTRLQPMMHAHKHNKFVLINELFTTAATYDAYIMGKRVMEHFIRNECYGVYVTHIQELAEEGEAVASLVAELDERDKRTRTFRMIRRKAEDGGYANAIVDKYHLNYEEIKERFG